MRIGAKSVEKASPREKVGVFCKLNGKAEKERKEQKMEGGKEYKIEEEEKEKRGVII